MAAADRILLSNLGFYGFHGAMAEENRLGQRFYVDIECHIDLSRAGHSDSLADTVSYAALYQIVADAFSFHRFTLIEALAQSIITAVLAQYPTIEAVRLRVRKPEAPIAMVLGEAAIELFRERG